MATDAEIEAAARALRGFARGVSWESLSDDCKDLWRKDAKDALEAAECARFTPADPPAPVIGKSGEGGQ